jgi:hypothetical protein
MHRRFLYSNDDSDEEDEEESLYEILAVFGLNKKTKSIKYKHERLNWQDHVRRLQYTKTFASRYHMTLPSFNSLVDLLRPWITVNAMKSRNSTRDNEPIYPEMIVGAGLRFLGGSFHKDIEDIYGISNHSSRRIIGMFVLAVKSCDELAIRLPQSTEALQDVTNGFAKCSSAYPLFHGCVSCIDGWLACINKPKEKVGVRPNDFFSGHYATFGLNVQAMCDSKLRFTYFAVAAAGKTNDNRAFSRCQDLKEWIDTLPEGYFIIGDNAYTITNRLLIPFTAIQLGNDEYRRTYNYFLSQLRIRIEMAFGRLTTKWRIFRRNMEGDLDRIASLIMTAARIHNFVIDHDSVDNTVNGLVGNFLDPLQWGVDTLHNIPQAPNNNGYLNDLTVLEDDTPSAQRNAILIGIVERDLRRPEHNVLRNLAERG